MGKRIFWIFMLMVVSVTTIAVLYIQSESFARLAKQNIQSRVARNLGVELNFDRLKIGVLPPSLSLLNVDVKVLSPANALGLGMDALFKADRLGFTFRMIQAFSSGISINKVFLSDAEVRLDLPKSSGGPNGDKLSEIVHRPIKVKIGEGFFLHIRQFELRNTMVDLGFMDGNQPARLFIKQIGYLALTPSEEGTDLVANLDEIKILMPKMKENLKTLKVGAFLRKNLILISSLDVQRKDAVMHAAGKLVGSIDNPNELRPDLDIILRGSIKEMADFEKELASFDGDVLVDAKVVGKIKDPAIQGKVEISQFHYSLWNIDKLVAAGSYGGGLAILDSLEAQTGGGRIALKNKLELSVPFRPETKVIQLTLNNLKFQDVAGDLRHDVNNLKLETDGTVGIKLEFLAAGSKAKLSALSLRPELAVRELELNNQVFDKKRPYKRIFKVAPFRMNGNIQWRKDQGEVRISESKLVFPSGVLDVRGSVSDAGFDLYGSSEQVDFTKEVGDIAGIPVAGEGSVRVHVHGPSKAVLMDFDLRQRNARFLNFDFGEINGRVTYDDKKSYLTISDLKGQKSSARYSVNGSVNVGDGDDISLAAVFEQGSPDDLFAIFAHQLKEISWIPHGMTGDLSAGVKVGGGYDGGLNTLEIDARVRGRNLSYKGEMVQEFDAQAGLTKGTIYARNATAKKYETLIKGDIDYKIDADMRYSLDVERGKLRNLDFLAAWGLPLDGLFRFHSEGKGRWETLESTSRFAVTNAFARTKPLPQVDFQYDTNADHSVIRASVGQDISLNVKIAANARNDSTAELKVSDSNFDYFLCLLSKANCTDPSIALRLRADGKFAWKGWNWTEMNGGGQLQEITLSKAGFYLRNPAPVEIKVVNGLVATGPIGLEGEGSKLVARAKGKVDGSSLDNQVKGTVSLKLLEFATPLIEEGRGKMEVDLGLRGDSGHANFQGFIAFQDGFLRLMGLDAPVEGLRGKLRFADTKVTAEGMQGQLGGGTVQVTGGLNLYLSRAPRFDIDLFLANNRLKFYPVNYAEFADAKLSLTGEHPPYLFSGTAHVKRVMMRNNFSVGSQKGLKNARYLPEKMGGSRSFYETKIRAVADSGIFVENDLLNAEFRGELTLLNNFEYPQMVVRAELVRGKLLFRSSTFTLDHALIRNPSPEIFNPQFSIGGTTNVDNYRINIFASGTTDKPKITFSSYPSIPQEDIVSLLAFGYRGEDTKKLNATDTNNIAYSEVGSILLDQLQINQNLQSKGLRVKLAPSVTNTEESIVHPHTATGQAAPKVYVQTQILRNLEASFGGTVGATQGQSVDARLEYRLGRKASVSAVYEQTPGLDTTEVRNSYGGDLKFRWGFR
ncbi:MAG: translocation/assembly module TamB domain-containing protein [Bacteriovoracia bacterium]